MGAKVRKLRELGDKRQTEGAIVALQRDVPSVDAFQRDTEKALVLQQKINKATACRLEVDAATQLTNEMKRQVSGCETKITWQVFDLRGSMWPLTMRPQR